MQRALKPKTPTLSWADAYVSNEVEQAEKRAQKALLEMQHQDGYWWAELQANVTITAEYIMLLQFLGLAETIKIQPYGKLYSFPATGKRRLVDL